MENGIPAILYLLSSILVILTTGCSMVSGQRGDIRVTSWRFLWKSEAIRFSVVDSNLVATLSVGQSASDEASVNAVTEAVVAGVVKGFVP